MKLWVKEANHTPELENEQYEGFISCLCEVKLLKNDLVATGYLSEFDKDHMRIEDANGRLATIEYGQVVKISIYSNRFGLRVVQGKVYTSNGDFMEIIEPIPLTDEERRAFFRINVRLHGTARLLEHGASEGAQPADSEDPEGKPVPVVVRNLSLNGMLISTNLEYQMGDVLETLVTLDGHETIVRCEVTRIIPTESKIREFGCKFLTMNNASSNLICMFLFRKQSEQIRMRKLI